MSAVTEDEKLATLDREMVEKLKPVSFGFFNNTERIVKAVEHGMRQGQPPSHKQRLALYRICWRFRKQIDDNAFIARVLIMQAQVTEVSEVNVRSWSAAADTPRGGLI